MAKGQNVQQVLREVCGTFEEVAHTNGAVASFAINDGDGEEDDEDDMNEEAWVHALKQQEIGSFPHEIAPVPANPSLAEPSSAAASSANSVPSQAAVTQQGASGSSSGSETVLLQLSISDPAAVVVTTGSKPALESPEAASAVGENAQQVVVV